MKNLNVGFEHEKTVLCQEVKELKAAEPAGGDDSEMKFVSPLLRQIMGSKLRGKAAVVGSSPATSEPSNDESKTLKTDVMKANLDELLDEKSDVSSPALSLDLQSQFITEDTVSKDYETTNEANLGLQTSQSTNSNEDSGTDSSTYVYPIHFIYVIPSMYFVLFQSAGLLPLSVKAFT